MQKTQIFLDVIPFDKSFPITRPACTKPPESAHLHNGFEIGFCGSSGRRLMASFA